MARKERLYLDTSVISAYCDEREPEKQEQTWEFWEKLRDYEVIISRLTIDEIERTPQVQQREKMMSLIEGFEVLEVIPEGERLSQEYVDQGIIPRKLMNDALQIAFATLREADYLVSWNFRHIVKIKTKKGVNAINTLQGYKTVEIISPLEI